MKLFGKCPSCKSEVSFNSSSNTRIEFAMSEGEIKKIQCKNCGTTFELFVNDINAKKSNLASLVAGLIFLLGTPLIVFLLKDFLLEIRGPYSVLVISGFFLVPSIIYFIILKDDGKRVSAFNRLKIKGENSTKA